MKNSWGEVYTKHKLSPRLANYSAMSFVFECLQQIKIQNRKPVKLGNEQDPHKLNILYANKSVQKSKIAEGFNQTEFGYRSHESVEAIKVQGYILLIFSSESNYALILRKKASFIPNFILFATLAGI